jgi:hypothetical protein
MLKLGGGPDAPFYGATALDEQRRTISYDADHADIALGVHSTWPWHTSQMRCPRRRRGHAECQSARVDDEAGRTKVPSDAVGDPGAGRDRVSRNIKVLSWVSFFQDSASEMLYPVLPIFLTTVLGAPVAVVGIIEGRRSRGVGHEGDGGTPR